MASGAYKNKTGLPFLFSFCLIFSFFNKLSENVGEAAGRQAGRQQSRDGAAEEPRRRRFYPIKPPGASPFCTIHGALLYMFLTRFQRGSKASKLQPLPKSKVSPRRRACLSLWAAWILPHPRALDAPIVWITT